MCMKILPVSGLSYNNNTKINFEAKKDENRKTQVPTNNLKKAVPTAALILAMMSDPIATQPAEAASMNSANTELPAPQSPPPRPRYIYPHHYRPVPPPVYYNPYHYDYITPAIIMMNYLQNLALMSNVYSGSVSPVSVGNVAFSRSDIKFVNIIIEDGVEYNNVVLNNGTNVTYPDQPEENYAVIYRDVDGYNFEGLSDAFIEGSNNRDRYILNGCQNTAVDVGGDDSIDRVLVQSYRVTPAYKRQYTKNVSVTASTGDIVNNRKVYDYDETTTYNGY